MALEDEKPMSLRDMGQLAFDLGDVLCLSAPFSAALSKLSRGKDRIEIAACEHVLKEVDDFVQNEGVGCQHFFTIQPEGAAIEGCDGASGFKYEQSSGGSVPWIQIELPISIKASAGGVGEVESGRPGTADAMGAQGDLLIEVDIWVFVTFAAGKTRRHEAFGQIVHARYVDFFPVEIGTFTFFCNKQLIAGGVVHYTRRQDAVGVRGETFGAMLESKRNAEDRETMREIGGAVEGVYVPAVFAVNVVAGALFAVDAMSGELFPKALNDEFF